METLLWGILCLSGCHGVSATLHQQYHYVADRKTWAEAQMFCRETYTDLATFDDITEMYRLLIVALPSGRLAVWFGLYSMVNWKWSLADPTYYADSGMDYRNWQIYSDNEPDFYSGEQFCVCMENTGRWFDDNCTIKYPFVCYDGTAQDTSFTLVNERMSWSAAQRHCRQNFIDLASVRNEDENEMIRVLVFGGDFAWIGLSREPDIFWSDGSNSSFRLWDDITNPLGSAEVVCGAADLTDSGRWRVELCNVALPFACYSAPPPVPVRRRILKLKIKSEGSSVNLNDQAVQADILKKLQDKLKEAGVGGVTLTWRMQAGKVFHEEEKEKGKLRDKDDL